MKIAFIETAWGDQKGTVEIERGEKFMKAARELGDFINALNLPAEQHNRLVELAIAQVLTAERNAFEEGLRLGRDYGSWEAEQPDNHQKATETSE